MTYDWTCSCAVLAVLVACGPQQAGTGDDGETGAPEDSSSAAPTEGVVSEGSATLETDATSDAPSVTTTVTDGPVETTEPDPSDTDPSDTDGPNCLAGEPSTDASFRVVLDAWPEQDDEQHDIDRVCVIDSVGVEAGTVITAVTCDVDGVPRGARFEIPAAPEGPVDWEAGQSVSLRSRVMNDEFGGDVALHVTLAGEPAALLVDGRDWWGDNVPLSQEIGPILRERVATCGADAEETRFELRYALLPDRTLSVWSGRRGPLAIDAAHLFAVDLDHSSEDCCHGSEHSLIRRIQSE